MSAKCIPVTDKEIIKNLEDSIKVLLKDIDDLHYDCRYKCEDTDKKKLKDIEHCLSWYRASSGCMSLHDALDLLQKINNVVKGR